MADAVKILISFGLIIFLLFRRVNAGLAMSGGALFILVLFGITAGEIADMLRKVLTDTRMLEMLAALYLIMMLEHLLRVTGRLERMSGRIVSLIGDRRVAMSVMPAIIGLLPSPGGARFSAPIVEQISGGANLGSHRKSFINYWFRHLWEYVSPLYPGILLVSAFLDRPVKEIMIYMIPLPLIMIPLGFFTAFRGVKIKRERADFSELGHALAALWPVAGVMLIVITAGLPVPVALAIVISAIFILERYNIIRIADTAVKSFSPNILILIFGIFVFKESLTVSGATDSIASFLTFLPTPVVVFLLPFLLGLVTGLTTAFVGLSFPILIPLLGGTDTHIVEFAFAFSAGYAGVLVSPVHLCLILTKDFFNSSLSGLYRILLPPALALVAVIILYFTILEKL